MPDVEARLGRCSPPPGYRIVRTDDHYVWVHAATDRESVIHWDKWAVYRGAWADYRKRQEGAPHA